MTLARVKATGRGRLNARLVIEGWPCEFVSSLAMAGTQASGVVRVHGLDVSTIKYGARTDILSGKLSGEGASVRVFDYKRIPSSYLARTPQVLTYLRSDITASATSVPSFDTSAFPSSGFIYLATETIKYDAVTGGGTPSFDSLDRAAFFSTAQAHFTSAGAGLAYPAITDWPQSIDGRRTWLYLYGDGDDLTSEGTNQSRGVVSGSVSFDGKSWTIPIESRVTVLSQKLQGEQLSYKIRGAYFSTAAPYLVRLHFPLTGDIDIAMTGHYENAAEFCTAFNAQASTTISSARSNSWGNLASLPASSAVTASDMGSGQILFTWFTGTSGTGFDCEISTCFDWSTGVQLRRVRTVDQTGAPGSTINTKYDGPASYPDGAWWSGPSRVVTSERLGLQNRTSGAPYCIGPSNSLADPRYIYLDGTPQSGHYQSKSEGDGISHDLMYGELSSSTDRRAQLDLTAIVIPVSTVKLGASDTITCTPSDTRGDSIDFVSALISSSPGTCNAQSNAPLLIDDDFVLPNFEPSSALVKSRTFPRARDATLEEVLAAEVLAAGSYLAESGGAFTIKELSPTLETDAATWTITDSDLVAGSLPVITRATDGIVSEVIYSTGYNAEEDEWQGTTYRVRDVGACSPNRAARSIEIKQRSAALTQPTVEGIASSASPFFAMFGSEYLSIQCVVGLKYLDAEVGDSVLFSCSLTPDVDGTMGVSSVSGFITGRSVDLSTARVTLEIYRGLQRFAGYAPQYTCTGALVSGSTFDLTLDATHGDEPSNYFAVGDTLHIYAYDSASPTVKTASVVSFSGYTLRVTCAGFVPSTTTWLVGVAFGDEYETSDALTRYAFVADSTRIISHSSTTRHARQLSI